ncbi:MAG: NADH-quinone oxidoreductase subunit A [Calditrichaeota bacterium]|nr:MAG: NADH-quinone oxidoreductase subunit A [Calditrichota bacterium]
MLAEYLPILFVMALAVLITGGILLLTHVMNPRIKERIKDSVYESGLQPQMEARLRYPIRFYVVAMMFILFDIEVIFMYPWAVVYKKFLSTGSFIFWEMVVFLAILFVGYIYLWKRGAFRWE